jgi:hypothetical protein
MSSKSIVAAVFAVAVSFAALEAQQLERWSKGEGQKFYPDDPVWTDTDTRDIPPVAKFDLSKSYEFVKETFGGSAKSFGPALNVNTLGEVPDSSWFVNRLGRFDMSVADVVRGPDRVDGPAAGTWQVTGRPDAGITPKFTIKDARGDTYLIKLDPAIAPELPSSVELISTKIFHAIGYHVPEDFIVTFDLSRLSIAPGAKLRTKTGGKRPIEQADVEAWLKDTPRARDGQIRALASRYVPGKVVGQFRFTGTRSDDANDIYAHERRRELRGMRVFAAWLNHDDARSINSIDTYVEADGRRYIRHYVQDFGSTLGSGSTSAQQPRGGNEYLIEPDKIGKGLASLGLWRRGWMNARYPDHLTLGHVEADFFEPQKWKTEYPQPAFDQMDTADAFWAARIASRFTNDMIRAIVDAAQLSDPGAARTLTDIIIKRRDKVVAYWIRQTNPIDEFRIDETVHGTDVVFDNAAIRVGAATPAATYVSRWSRFDNASGAQEAIGASATIEDNRARIPADAWGPADASGARYAAIAIETYHPEFPVWKNAVTITVRKRNGEVDIAGIDRPGETGKQ